MKFHMPFRSIAITRSYLFSSPQLEGPFAHFEIATKLGYKVEYSESHQDKPRNLYQELMIRRRGKKEILYWLMKKATDYHKHSLLTEDTLDFDAEMMKHYLCELIFNPEDGQDYFSEFDCLYDELYSVDKEK